MKIQFYPYYIYFIGSISYKDHLFDAIKIGYASNPIDRMAQLQTGNYNLLVLIEYFGYESLDEVRLVEKQLHKKHRDEWIKGEWFKPSANLLSSLSSFCTRDMSEHEKSEFIVPYLLKFPSQSGT